MKTLEDIAAEIQKQRRLIWYIDFLRWWGENPIEEMPMEVFDQIRTPAVAFAGIIEQYYKDEIDTRRLIDTSDVDRAKLLGECTALAWVLEEPLREIEKRSGIGVGERLPSLPGVWDPKD